MTPGAWSKSLSIDQKQPPAKIATAVSAPCALVIAIAPIMATARASLFLCMRYPLRKLVATI